jgi:hypothetical protein
VKLENNKFCILEKSKSPNGITVSDPKVLLGFNWKRGETIKIDFDRRKTLKEVKEYSDKEFYDYSLLPFWRCCCYDAANGIVKYITGRKKISDTLWVS